MNDVATVQQNLLKNLDDANAAIVAQARLNRGLQQELMGVRMMPFASQAERLFRIVRQTSKELGKRANFDIVGGPQAATDHDVDPTADNFAAVRDGIGIGKLLLAVRIPIAQQLPFKLVAPCRFRMLVVPNRHLFGCQQRDLRLLDRFLHAQLEMFVEPVIHRVPRNGVVVMSELGS